MGLGDYILGLALMAGIWGAAIGVAALVVARLLPGLSGAPRLLAGAIVAVAALVASALLPAIVGVLSIWTALGASAAGLVAAWFLIPRRPGSADDDTPPATADSGPVSWTLATLAVAFVAVWTLAKAWAATREASQDVDTLTFHLPVVGRWLETGSIWQVDQFTPLLPNGNYPHNGDLIFLTVVGAFDSDAFVRVVNVPFLALAGVAAYALARELAAPRATAVLCGAVFAALPVMNLATFDGAKTDPIMLACFGAGAVFLVRHGRRGRRSDLVFAGLGIGLAFGTKWYGVPAGAVMVVVWAGAALLRRAGTRAVVSGAATLCGLIAAAGGIWLVRNAVESGSPLFPVALPPLFDTPRDFVRECAGFSIADYFGDGQVWADYILPAYRDNYGLAGALLVAGWAGAGALALVARARRRPRPETASVLTLAAAVLILAAVYTITPYTALGTEGEPILVGANTRWLTPALLLCAALLAVLLGRLGRARLPLEAVAVIAVVLGLDRGADLTLRTVFAAAVVLGFAAAAAYGTLLLRARVGGGRLVPVVASALALLAVLAVAYDRQSDYHADRFAREGDPVLTYLSREATSGYRVAIAGVPSPGQSPVWPAFGPRLGNHVDFLGPMIDGQQYEYADRAAWTRALREGRFDLLVVGRGGYARECPLPGRETDDDAWARAAGFERIAATERLTLYRVR